MKLTEQQGFSLILAFLLGNVLSGIGGGGDSAKTGYLAVFLSLGLFVLFALFFQQFAKRNSSISFFGATRELFGKAGYILFLVLLVIYSFLACFLSVVNYMDFIRSSTANNFPITVGIFIVLLLTVYLCFKGIKTVGRYAQIILPVVVASILLLLIMGIKEIREITIPLPSSFSQLFEQGWQVFCSPFAEILFLWVLLDHFQRPEKIGKISIKAAIFTTILFALVYLFNVNLLGVELLQQTKFPTYFAASLVKVGVLVEKAESLITLSYSFCDILYSGICLLVSVKGVCKLLEEFKVSSKNTKKITAFSAVIFMFVLYITGIIPSDLSPYYHIISLIFVPFTVGIPVLLSILSKRKIQNKSSCSKKL